MPISLQLLPCLMGLITFIIIFRKCIFEMLVFITLLSPSGSVQDDSRCFVHIYNIDAAPLEVHHGMEWLRIKVQANAFARDQIRRMMSTILKSFLLMLTFRYAYLGDKNQYSTFRTWQLLWIQQD